MAMPPSRAISPRGAGTTIRAGPGRCGRISASRYTVRAYEMALHGWDWCEAVCLWAFRFPWRAADLSGSVSALVTPDFIPRPIYTELAHYAHGEPFEYSDGEHLDGGQRCSASCARPSLGAGWALGYRALAAQRVAREDAWAGDCALPGRCASRWMRPIRPLRWWTSRAAIVG